jgi:hypothetical protein
MCTQAHLDHALGFRRSQRLCVGVRHHEFATLKPGGNHVVDGIAAGAAHTEHGDMRFQFPDIRHLQVDRHFVTSWCGVPHRLLTLPEYAGPPSR